MKTWYWLGIIGLLQAQSLFSGTAGANLFSDRNASNVGDILTVYIVEEAKASRGTSIDIASQTKVGSNASLGSNAYSFIPLFNMGAGVNNSQNDDEGTSQHDAIRGKITASITEITEEGLFRIRGKRAIKVNGEGNTMKISGYVRPRDVYPNNIVYSYNIADAKITYRKSNLKNAVIKPGVIKKWGVTLLGFAMVGLAVSQGGL